MRWEKRGSLPLAPPGSGEENPTSKLEEVWERGERKRRVRRE